MKLHEFRSILAEHPDSRVIFGLPSGEAVPQHYHVTEVGYVTKRFFDCGGTERTQESCVVQLWTAHDIDHQLTAEKISAILLFTGKVFPHEGLDVEVEYQLTSTTTFKVENVNRVLGKLVFQLAAKHTDCLAPDKCGIECG